MTQRRGEKSLVSFFCSLMDKNTAMLNLSIQNKEGWSLKRCKSPLNGIIVKLLTFNEGFFRLDMICRFALRECRIDRKKSKRKKGKKKERKRGAKKILSFWNHLQRSFRCVCLHVSNCDKVEAK